MGRFKSAGSYHEISEWLENRAGYMKFSGGVFLRDYPLDCKTNVEVVIDIDAMYVTISLQDKLGEVTESHVKQLETSWIEDKSTFIDEVDKLLEAYIG